MLSGGIKRDKWHEMGLKHIRLFLAFSRELHICFKKKEKILHENEP